MKNKYVLLIALFLLFFGVAGRLVGHPANFAPVMAIALFAGVYLPRKWSIILPVAIMFLADIILGFYHWQVMAAVYLSMILAALIGQLVKKNKNILTIVGGTLAGSLAFFLVTNFAVWAFSDWYAHSLSGLLLNYSLAVPFFRNSLMGDLFYVVILFGAAEVVMAVTQRQRLLKRQRQN